MKIKVMSLVLASMIGLLGMQSAMAAVSVIVNSASSLANVNQTEVVNLFLNKSKTIQGERLTPVDQSKGQATRQEFYENVVRKNESQLKAYWSRLIFTGKGLPPAEVGNDKTVLERIKADPSAIGYVSSDSVDGSVKVLATF